MASHVDKCGKAVGKCPKCGQLPTWFNNVPLTAYCWGPENAEHEEMNCLVPSPEQPYGNVPKHLSVWMTAEKYDKFLHPRKKPRLKKIHQYRFTITGVVEINTKKLIVENEDSAEIVTHDGISLYPLICFETDGGEDLKEKLDKKGLSTMLTSDKDFEKIGLEVLEYEDIKFEALHKEEELKNYN